MNTPTLDSTVLSIDGTPSTPTDPAALYTLLCTNEDTINLIPENYPTNPTKRGPHRSLPHTRKTPTMNPNPTLIDLDTALKNLASARSAYQAAVDAREKHIIKLHSQKTTPINQLAENAGVSRQWVTRLLRNAKIPTHGHNRHLPHTTNTTDLATLRELATAVTTTHHASEKALTERNRIITHLIHNAGHSQGSIARHTGISRATIGRITTT